MNAKSMIPWKREEHALGRHGSESTLGLWQRRMNDLFDDMFEGSSLWRRGGQFMPDIDVAETENEVRITAELPGLEQKDVEVMLSGNTLTLKGEKKEEMEETHGEYHHSERSWGFFQRDVELPPGISADTTKATFKNGVLKVVIPKTAEAQSTRRKIEFES